jgi:hypothetical protein
MTIISNRNDRHSERGVALLIAIFTLLLITAIGAGMIMLTNTETSTSANFRDEQTAYFGARAGIEEVRDRLRSTASNSVNGSLPTALPGIANGTLYILNPTNGEADTPWITNGNAYPDTQICSEITRITGAACPTTVVGYTQTTASASYALVGVSPASWKWTRINLKTNLTSSGTTVQSSVETNPTGHTNYIICWTGSNEMPTPLAGTPAASCSAAGSGYLPVYVMTTLAVTPSGSRRMIQAEATATTFPPLPGAMIFDGSNPVYGAPNSNAFGVTGNDVAQGPNSGAGCPTAHNQPALGGYDVTSVSLLTGDVGSRGSSYTGSGSSTPSVANVSTSLGSLATVAGLEALQTQITSMASSTNIIIGNASGITNVGTDAAPVINVVTGDLTLGGGFSGSGILLVEGNLTMSGNPNYNGLILVIGKGTMTKNGGGNGTLNGSLLVANLYDNSGIYTAAHLLPGTSAPGIPTLNWNGGGNANINYDSCWASALSSSLNYRIVAVREMMY